HATLADHDCNALRMQCHAIAERDDGICIELRHVWDNLADAHVEINRRARHTADLAADTHAQTRTLACLDRDTHCHWVPQGTDGGIADTRGEERFENEGRIVGRAGA